MIGREKLSSLNKEKEKEDFGCLWVIKEGKGGNTMGYRLKWVVIIII